MTPQIASFFDPATWTVSYVVYDRHGGRAAIVDPVLDYDPKSGRTSTRGAAAIRDFIREHNLTVDWILETHAHADHLSAAAWLQRETGGKTAIGDGIGQVQAIFKGIFHLEADFATDGRQFDHLFADRESFHVGELQGEALFVPGHTPADMAYRIGDAVFVGDTLFMPDVGSARCDFPGGDAATLYHSARRLLSLPPDTRLFMCHDYPPAHREPQWQTTVAEQRAGNIHLHDGVSEAEFVQLRQARDATLEMPVLILPAVQINIRAGQLPPPEANGARYLKIPLDLL
ncbi:MBL fold metallo-hydrolase [uncultured Aquitalea sp.]|uniref:MBL fold metallo-hydrolase n=1 Tax=uncultured Aquitalea sp. TaxID=540272 RepID=UPI0025D62ECB|nr:MBL fold metallo-hydrolase [uncultured Aquitalea sp.]